MAFTLLFRASVHCYYCSISTSVSREECCMVESRKGIYINLNQSQPRRDWSECIFSLSFIFNNGLWFSPMNTFLLQQRTLHQATHLSSSSWFRSNDAQQKVFVQLKPENLFAWLNSVNLVMSEKSVMLTGVGALQISAIWKWQRYSIDTAFHLPNRLDFDGTSMHCDPKLN